MKLAALSLYARSHTTHKEPIMVVELKMDGSDWEAYVREVSRAQGYALDEAQQARVAAAMRLVGQVVQPLLALDVPMETEPAPVYCPNARS
jgi:hypothetical protein